MKAFKEKHKILSQLKNFEVIMIKGKEHVVNYGFLGELLLAKNKINSKFYALKKISLINLTNEKKNEIKERLDQYILLTHKNLIKIYSIIEDINEITVVYEYFNSCSLYELINIENTISYNEKNISYIYLKLLDAVKFLHDNNIIHKYINSENILIDEDKNVKLINIIDEDEILDKVCLEHMSYEIINDLEPTKQTDIWNLGCLLYELYYGKYPFLEENNSNEEQVLINISNKTMTYAENPSEKFKSLINLIIKSESNLAITNIQSHEWVEEFKLCNLEEKVSDMDFKLNKLNTQDFKINEMLNLSISEDDNNYSIYDQSVITNKSLIKIDKNDNRNNIRQTVKSFYLDQLNDSIATEQYKKNRLSNIRNSYISKVNFRHTKLRKSNLKENQNDNVENNRIVTNLTFKSTLSMISIDEENAKDIIIHQSPVRKESSSDNRINTIQEMYDQENMQTNEKPIKNFNFFIENNPFNLSNDKFICIDDEDYDRSTRKSKKLSRSKFKHVIADSCQNTDFLETQFSSNKPKQEIEFIDDAINQKLKFKNDFNFFTGSNKENKKQFQSKTDNLIVDYSNDQMKENNSTIIEKLRNVSMNVDKIEDIVIKSEIKKHKKKNSSIQMYSPFIPTPNKKSISELGLYTKAEAKIKSPLQRKNNNENKCIIIPIMTERSIYEDEIKLKNIEYQASFLNRSNVKIKESSQAHTSRGFIDSIKDLFSSFNCNNVDK